MQGNAAINTNNCVNNSVTLTPLIMVDAHEAILRKVLDGVAKEQQYEDYKSTIAHVPTEGASFTSTIFKVTVSGKDRPDLNLFAKVAAVGETFRSQMLNAIFDIEDYVYSTLAKFYTTIQDKYQIPTEDRLLMPKFYAYNSTYMEETLVLQDLVMDGFTVYDRMECMSLEYATRTIEELAKLHALSIVFQEEYPEDFEKAVKILKLKNLRENKAMGDAMVQMTSSAADSVCAAHQGRLRGYLAKALAPGSLDRFVGPQRRPVLVHGDFRMSNTMFKCEENKVKVIIIDYQTVHVGAGVRDVLYFLLTGTDEQFRSEHFHQLLEHYYESVCRVLRRMQHDPDKLFPRPDYDHEAKENMPCGLITAMMALPAVTASAENAPKADSELAMESLTKLNTNDLFKSRINGLVRDYIKWGEF